MTLGAPAASEYGLYVIKKSSFVASLERVLQTFLDNAAAVAAAEAERYRKARSLPARIKQLFCGAAATAAH
jgi:hypothetical protein